MSSFDIALKSFGVVSHGADVGSDIWTGLEFLARGDIWWGTLTLAFVVLSMLITTFIIICSSSIEFKRRTKVLFIACFPLVPLGTLCWNLKSTWETYRSSDTSNNKPEEDIVNNSNTNDISNIRHEEDIESNSNANDTSNINNPEQEIESNINASDTSPGKDIESNSNANENNRPEEDTENNSNINDTSNINITEQDTEDNSNANNADDSSSTDSIRSEDIPPHADAAMWAKLSECFTEALPQCCIGTHVVFQTRYVSDVGGTVEWYQWASLMLSIASLSLAIATNGEWLRTNSKGTKALMFFIALPWVLGRLLVCATMGTIHSALFLLPLGTDFLAFFIMRPINSCLGVKLWERKSVIIAVSSINTCYAIGGFFTPVDQAIAITSLVLNVIAALIQIGMILN